jgi:excinuclease ABC subunit A
MSFIEVVGARANNLKNVSINIPRGEIVVLTGVSGSGKSSLAIDTIHAESERQFIETLSLQSRQFIRQFPRADVDSIKGLPPTIAITQHSRINNKRNNVAVLSEIYDYLRLLFARAGIVHCHKCNRIIQNQSTNQILNNILALPVNVKFIILAPLVRDLVGEHTAILQTIFKAGFSRVRIDNEFYDIQNCPNIDPTHTHNIDAVIDRLILKSGVEPRLVESLQLALKHGEGNVTVAYEKERRNNSDGTTTPVWQDILFSTLHSCPTCNINYTEIEPRTFSYNSPYGICKFCQGTGIIVTKNHNDNSKNETICPECNGTRLGVEARNVTLCGKYIFEICAFTAAEAAVFFSRVEFPADKREIVKPAIEQILLRLEFMNQNGLDYMRLDRAAGTLSGGELQRVRLANALGISPAGVCYVLDEPTAGLHSRDTEQLIKTLRKLQTNGNSLLIVEHDEDIMRGADRIIDIGIGAGESGGRVVGEMRFVKRANKLQVESICPDGCKESLTIKYLNGDLSMPVPKKRRKISNNSDHVIKLTGVATNNLRGIDVTFPLGGLVCVTGVSGSGKSSLVGETLVPLLRNHLYGNNPSGKEATNLPSKNFAGKCSGIFVTKNINRLIEVDQSPIGRSPRSNLATYTGLFDEIRRLFAKTKEAKRRGYDAGWFITGINNVTKNTNKNISDKNIMGKNIADRNYRYKNRGGGCCIRCNGYGTIKIKMRLLGDLVVTCPDCKGKRFNKETLEVLYKGKSIADVLDMSVLEASKFFENIPAINRILLSLCNIGLGYLKPGQSAVTLSGGEAQRIKLATELAKTEINILKQAKNLQVDCIDVTAAGLRGSGNMLYILDEPTIGLHKHDVGCLLEVLFGLIDYGGSVIVVEHNLDVIRAADWVIDLGPGGGVDGGDIVATGTPKDIAKNKNSITGKYL